MKKIGISIGAMQNFYGVERALEICAESGFDAVGHQVVKPGADPIVGIGLLVGGEGVVDVDEKPTNAMLL